MRTEYIPYTYLIGWSTLNYWYYGVEVANKRRVANPSNLWTTYFTSSRKVTEMRKDHGEPDIIMVRRTFKTAADAYKWEQTVLHRLGVVRNEKWLNQAVYGRKDFSNDPTRIAKTISSRRKNGDWHSQKTKDKIGVANSKPMTLSDEERKRRANRFTELNLSEDFINKNKEGRTRRWDNPEERRAQATRMKTSSLSNTEKRVANMRTPEARDKRRVLSKNNWDNVADAMKEAHAAFRNDPIRKEEHRQKTIRMHQQRRGWSHILIDDLVFDTIRECANYLKKNEKWVRKKIGQGEIITR